MNIDREYPTEHWAWDAMAVRRYALAIGAPSSPLDEEDLRLVIGPDLVAFPTLAVLLADAHSLRYFPLPGLEYDPLDVIYAGHELELFGPLPVAVAGTTSTRLVRVGDVSSGVLVVREAQSRDGSGRLLARNVVTSIIRGASLGVEAEKPSTGLPWDDKAYDLEIEVPTLPHQALLYAQTGDENPLHWQPSAAREAGFARPILHGLCSYGMVAHALLRELAEHRWSSLKRISARFTSPVVPGETILVRTRREPGGCSFSAWVPSDDGKDRKVLDRGRLEFALEGQDSERGDTERERGSVV
jgi:hypothetical protein